MRDGDPRLSDDHPPRVSVIIPTCNRREVLERCLSAVARQTHPSFEVIVIDDASTDDTAAMVARFAERHRQLCLTFLRNERQMGANPSRNRAIAAASGELVALMDDDSIAHEDWLEKLVGGFVEDDVAAVVGMSHNPPPRNIYELTMKGTQRVRGPYANRLVGCNMCVRRDLLRRYMLDEDRAEPARGADGRPDLSVSGRGDEEGLFLMLQAAGYQQRAVPDAVVLHEQHYTRRSFFRQAYRGGRSAARLVYKYHLPPRFDLLPFILAYGSLLLWPVDSRFCLLSAGLIAVAVAAVVYNDLARKGKSVLETAASLPMLLIYYHVRLYGYIAETLRLHFARHGVVRVRLEQPSQAPR